MANGDRIVVIVIVSVSVSVNGFGTADGNAALLRSVAKRELNKYATYVVVYVC